MREFPFFSSVTRISDLETTGFDVAPLPRNDWEMGDYVVGEVLSQPNDLCHVELPTGRLAKMLKGDRVVGAWGVRAATLEAAGDFRLIEPDGHFHQLTPGGLFGHLTSASSFLPPLPELGYRGHVVRGGLKATMPGCLRLLPERPPTRPVVLVIGTSMSAGKTTAARVLVRLLKGAGRKVLAAKLTGAARYRDVLTMHDAGADWILDFIDAGLPSTVCAEEVYKPALRQLLARTEELAPEVVVAEAGASPFEPYNGSVVMEELKERICLTVLCASDPYAVVGVMRAFDVCPDLVTGLAASTGAGITLIEKLTELSAVNILEEASHQAVLKLLAERGLV